MKPFLLLERNIVLYLLLAATFCCLALVSVGQTLDFGKSYINITKGAAGGTVEPGDILEIRGSIAVRAGTFDSCAFYDVIPTGTSFVSGSIRVLTNEGKTYKQFTDAMNDDCGWISGTLIRINLGYGSINPSSAVARGRITSTSKPSVFGSACVMLASYRVTVTAAINSNINMGSGFFTYQTGLNPVQSFYFNTNPVKVITNYGLCSRPTDTNMFTAEYNGTFGSGKSRNRSASTSVPPSYTLMPLDIGLPNDNTYGISNNTSTRSNYTTTNNWPKPDLSSPTHRVFTNWDIIGDHSSAMSDNSGNNAADTVANANSGYMLVVNAAFRTDSFFQQTVSGLCPNTYYEISCWIRNLCAKCGCDSNGKGATDITGPPYYIPTAVGDSSGVNPNISFEINGVDYYTTGNIPYTGAWVQKGFGFQTGSSQTSITLKLFNNAPGGSGNDWALDDISVAASIPLMSYSPSPNPYFCYGNAYMLYDTVWSDYPSYNYYIWQRSTDNGTTWTNSGVTGPVSPTWNGTAWEYVASHLLPPARTQLTDSADLYRLVVAGSSANLSSTSCRFMDPATPMKMHIMDCGIPLGVQMISFTGRAIQEKAFLDWTTGKEMEPVQYEIERSADGLHFNTIGKVSSKYEASAETNSYSYIDPLPGGAIYYYRIRVVNYKGEFAYSRTIQLMITRPGLYFTAVINPFCQSLRFDISSDKEETVTAELINTSGTIVRRKLFTTKEGVNRFSFDDTYALPAAVYFLQVRSGNARIQKTVLKKNQ